MRSFTIIAEPMPSGNSSSAGIASVPVGKWTSAERVPLHQSTSVSKASDSVRKGIIIRSVVRSMNGTPTLVRGWLRSKYSILPTVKMSVFIDGGGMKTGGVDSPKASSLSSPHAVYARSDVPVRGDHGI